MQRLILASLFTVLIFFLAACNNQPLLTQTETEDQEFVLWSDPDLAGLQTASTFTRIPRLTVQLSIHNEVDSQGNPTGKRYGQAAFFWTDKARSRGGSNLGGTVSVILRDADNKDLTTTILGGGNSPIMTNIDLYKQPGYEDHIVKTTAVDFSGRMCVEVWGLNLLSSNGYSFEDEVKFDSNYDSLPVIFFCEKGSVKFNEGTDLRFVTVINNRVALIYPNKPFTLLTDIGNMGSRPAKNVYVTFEIPYYGLPEGLAFVKDDSETFDCSSQEDLGKQATVIACFTERLRAGIERLPLTFVTTPNHQSWMIDYAFNIKVATSTPERDTTNNETISVAIVY